jgi:transcriptional regulator with XRE-family HTH domain
MATRDSIIVRGRRKGAAAQQRFCDEIRVARVSLGKSQAVVAAQAGISRAAWTRYEHGDRSVPSWDVAARMAAAVGLDLVIQLFPSERILRDAAHVELLRDLRSTLGPRWAWRYEVRIGPGPDQRAWDAVAEHRTSRVKLRIDAETRPWDCQQVLRRTRAKADRALAVRAAGDAYPGDPGGRGLAAGGRAMDDGGRVVLAIRDTVRNRLALRAAHDIVTVEFPVPARTALRLLRHERDPGGDAILVIRRQSDGARGSAAPPRPKP